MISPSHQSALFTAFSDWLNTNANEIDWGEYFPKKGLSDRPSGAIQLIPIPKVYDGSLQGGIRYDYQLYLNIETRKLSEEETIKSLLDIQAYLYDLIFVKLRRVGISGDYLGITLTRELVNISPKKPPTIKIDKKQDNYTPGSTSLYFEQINP